MNVPQQMVWVGPDAVMMCGRKFGLLMVGPSEEWVQHQDEDEQFHCSKSVTADMTADSYDIIKYLKINQNF